MKNEPNDVFEEFRNWLNYMLNFLGEEKIQITADRVFSQNEVKQMFTATVQDFKDKLLEDGRKAGEKAAEKKHADAMKAESRRTARELKQSGVDQKIICRSTGLSVEEIRKL